MLQAVRFLPDSDDVVEGLAVPFHGILPGDKDLFQTRFTPNTRYCLDWFTERPLLYHHGVESGGAGMPKELRLEPIGTVRTADLDIRVGNQVSDESEEGIWARAQLNVNHRFIKEVKGLLKRAALGFSHATMDHLVDIDTRSGEVIQWPLCELTLTPQPANLLAMPMRSMRAFIEDLEATGVVPNDEAMPWLLDEESNLVYPDSEGMRAAWSTAMQNNLPDSSFAYVEKGLKDKDGKTMPRSKRYLVYKDANGKPDATHVRNALARLDQTDIPDAAKASAKTKLLAAAKTLGIQVSDKRSFDMAADEAVAALRTAGDSRFAHVSEDGGLHLDISDKDHVESTIKRFKSFKFPNADARDAARKKVEAAAKKFDVAVPGDALVDEVDGQAVKALSVARSASPLRANVASDAVPFERSFEDIRNDISALLNDSPSPYGPIQPYSTIVGTYPTFVIVAQTDDDCDTTYWKIAYTLDDDNAPVLGDQIQMDQFYAPTANPDDDTTGPMGDDGPQTRSAGSLIPFSLDAQALAQRAGAFVKRTKDLRDRRRQQDRPLSATNLKQIDAVRSLLGASAGEVQAIYDETAQHAADVAKASNPAYWEAAAMELELMTLSTLNPLPN